MKKNNSILLEKIIILKEKLNELLEDHDFHKVEVLKTSRELDELIVELQLMYKNK